MKYIFFIVACLLVTHLHTESLRIKITDDSGNPIPYVVIHSSRHTTLSDTLGYAHITVDRNSGYTFSRLGFKKITLAWDTLNANTTVKMQTSSIIADDFIVHSAAQALPFRTITNSQRILVSDLNTTFTTIDDLMKNIPTIDIKGIGLAGERQTISLGSHPSRHTVIMLDNIVLNPTGQAVDLSSISASQIESVEIVRNNASVDTGSGGIAGMVIFHTKKSSRNQFFLTQSIGSFSTQKQNIGFTLHHDNTSYSFSTSRQIAKNDFEYAFRDEIKSRANNSKNITNINTDIRYQHQNFLSIYSLKYQKFNKQLPGPVNYEALYRGAYQDGFSLYHSLYASSLYHLPTAPLHLDMLAYHHQNNSTYINDSAPIPIFLATDESIQSIHGAKVGVRKSLPIDAIQTNFSLHTEYKKETFEVNDLRFDRSHIDKVYQETVSLTGSSGLQWDIILLNQELLGSYRTDFASNHKNYSSWRIEQNNHFAGYIPLSLKVNLGTSFMLPSFYDLNYIGDFQSTGNPDLLPEKSFGYRIEGAVETNPSLTVAYWENNTKNLIYWNRSVLGWKPHNLATAQIKNYEVNGQYRFLRKNTFSATYLRTIAKDKTVDSFFYDKYIIYTPSYQWNIQLNLNAGDLHQGFTYQAKGKQWSTRDQLIPPISGYELFHTKSMYEIRSGATTTTLSLSVYNVFDKRYENYIYIPEPGRHWEISIGIQIW
jgi:outer membrane cobalamin receptor